MSVGRRHWPTGPTAEFTDGRTDTPIATLGAFTAAPTTLVRTIMIVSATLGAAAAVLPARVGARCGDMLRCMGRLLALSGRAN